MTSSISLTPRYLWATGDVAGEIPLGNLVADRYHVVAPHIWQDTKLDSPPPSPATLPDTILPYARLYGHRLHIPEVYGICVVPQGNEEVEVLLLDNIPIAADGALLPAIADGWPRASAVRQVYWLWQWLELWTPLAAQGVVNSLLNADNIRVDGWRLRLRELTNQRLQPLERSSPTIADLATLWLAWCPTAQAPLQHHLTDLCEQMRQPDATLDDIRLQLNRLLLEQAAQQPLRISIAGLSDSGPQRSHNEDSCYPTLKDLQEGGDSPLIPYLAIVCDGIGGHDAGEVASQLAVQTIKLLVQSLLWDTSQQSDIQPPDLIIQRLTACTRVVNNQISAQNDQQGRELRQRMGTTLVMAVQIPQMLPGADGKPSNAHELYLCNVGDSRAYWITAQSCQQLTIDDDIAARDVRVGYSLRQEALQRLDGGILTQAVGTRDATMLRPSVQRFIIEEDGILLLCSDGLSDNNWVEQSWQDYAASVLNGTMSLDVAVGSLIDLANQRNGHDNTSVILMLCHTQIPKREPQLLHLSKPELSSPSEAMSESSQALLDMDAAESTRAPDAHTSGRSRSVRALVTLVVIGGFLLGFSLTGLLLWARIDPLGFQQWRDRIIPTNTQ